MVRPPSEEIQEAAIFFHHLRLMKGIVMGKDPANWLVWSVVVGFISFVIWAKIKFNEGR